MNDFWNSIHNQTGMISGGIRATVKRKIIGVDMGDCQVAVATPVFNSSGRVSGIINLKLNHKMDTVIPAEIWHEGEFFNFFKECPDRFDECIGNNHVTRREIIYEFFKNLMQNIIKYNDEISEKDSILMYVGCPASDKWKRKEFKDIYQKLIQEATGVNEVRVVTESRAAMFSALEGENKRTISAYKGAGVSDTGSSTWDFTYMKSGTAQREISWNLGARKIEQNLREQMCEEAKKKAKEKGLQLKEIKNYSELESQLRMKKEAYFNKELTKQTCKLVYTFECEDGSEIDVTLSINDETMKKALEEQLIMIPMQDEEDGHEYMLTGSWKKLCRQFFQEAKDYLDAHGLPMQEIVLTGGASKMEFIAEYAQEAFPEATVSNSETPSYSVSHGLVWVAVVDEMQQECVVRIKNNVLKNNNCNLKKLRKHMSKIVEKKVYKIFEKETITWENSYQDLSLNDLKADIDSQLKRKSTKKYIIDKQEKLIDKWNDAIKKELELKVKEEAKSILSSSISDKLMIPSNEWDQLSSNIKHLGKIKINVASILGNLNVTGGINPPFQFNTLLNFIFTILCNWGWFSANKQVTMHTTLNQKQRNQAAAQIYKKEDDIKDAAHDKFKQAFKNAINAKKFEERILKIATAQFEIVTLRRFEN